MSWKKVKLGEVAKVLSSKRIFAHQYVDKGIPFYRQKEIILKQNKEIITNPLYISLDVYENIKKKFGAPQKGDLLITAVGSLGIPYIVEDEEFYFKDGNLIWLKDFDQRVDSNYVYYWALSKIGQNVILSRTIGSAQSALTIDILKQIEIPCPSLDIQQTIVSILKSYDNLIENNQKQIKLLEEAAQRLYKEWFIDLRFPGYENAEIIDGVPEGWYINRADHYFKITIGKTPSRAEKQWFTNSGEGTPWISISDMGESGAFAFYSKEGLTADAIIRHNMKVVPKGTILVSFKLTVGRVAITSSDMCTNEAIAHFHIDNDLDRAYTYCYLNNFEYDSLGNTSSISKAINSKIIKSMPFIMPTGDILRQFSMIVQPILDQIELKQKIIFRLTEARDRLLPKLMSGEIEV